MVSVSCICIIQTSVNQSTMHSQIKSLTQESQNGQKKEFTQKLIFTTTGSCTYQQNDVTKIWLCASRECANFFSLDAGTERHQDTRP